MRLICQFKKGSMCGMVMKLVINYAWKDMFIHVALES